jgi:hypothetical protein
MQRALAVDVSICPRCGGDMRLIALIRDHAIAEKILRHVGLWSRGPPVGGRTAIAA